MDLNWLDYLEQYEGQNVDGVRKILTTESETLDKVVGTALNAHPFMTKKEARHLVESDFINPKKAPSGVDPIWVKANMDKVVDKINTLTEAEIKIIIKTDDKMQMPQMPSAMVVGEPVGSSDVSAEMEGQSVLRTPLGITPRPGRGRPKGSTKKGISVDQKPQPTGSVPNFSGTSSGGGFSTGAGEALGLSEDEMVAKLTEMGYSVSKQTELEEPRETGAEANSELNSREDADQEEDLEANEEPTDDISDDKEMDLKWSELVADMKGDSAGDKDREHTDGTSEKEYADGDAGLEKVTDEDDDDEVMDTPVKEDAVGAFLNSFKEKKIEEEIKVLKLKKPVDTIKVGASGKIAVDGNQARFSGGTVEVPEEIEQE